MEGRGDCPAKGGGGCIAEVSAWELRFSLLGWSIWRSRKYSSRSEVYTMMSRKEELRYQVY